MSNRYYAVVKGRIPGIYQDWESAKAQVNGFAGCIYKGFSTLTEAKRFMKYPTYGKPVLQNKKRRKSVKRGNVEPQTTNPLQRESFYDGEKSPWEYENYITCIETVQQTVIDQLFPQWS